LQLIDAPEPTLKAGQVKVDIKASGLCHTDVTIVDDPGWMKSVNAPVILGHECAGVVAEVADDVTDYQVGDRVGVCPIDLKSMVSIGGVVDGAYAEKVVVPHTQLIPLPDNVSFVDGAAATDAGMTSHRAIFGVGGAKKGTKVGIVGMGGIGGFGVQLALAAGCEVYVADPKPEEQAIAKKLGVAGVFDDAIDMKDVAPQVIVDCAGFNTTTAHALAAVAPLGKVVVVGMGVLHSDISTWDLIMKRASVVGSNGGDNEDIAACYKEISAGKVHPITTTIKFDEIGAGLDRLRRGGVTGRLIAAQP
ncbi:MAG: alcohol dehydrogenase catalytic domain-containing protein, partial [Limosilactobacillus sp.]